MEPRQGTGRDTWIAVVVATLFGAVGFFMVLEAFRLVDVATTDGTEELGAAPQFFLAGTGVLVAALGFAAWKSRRDQWVKWWLAAAFVTFASVVVLGQLGPVISQPITAAIVLRIDDGRFVKGRVLGVVLFLVAFGASLPLGPVPLVIAAGMPFVTVALADRFMARRLPTHSG